MKKIKFDEKLHRSFGLIKGVNPVLNAITNELTVDRIPKTEEIEEATQMREDNIIRAKELEQVRLDYTSLKEDYEASNLQDLVVKLAKKLDETRSAGIKVLEDESTYLKALSSHDSTMAKKEADSFKIVPEAEINKAFQRLLNSYSIKATYPQKQSAMDVAVKKAPKGANSKVYFDLALSSLQDA